MKKWALAISLLVLTLWIGKAIAYDNKETHREMTAIAIQHSSLLIDSYLAKHLGTLFQEGIETKFVKNTVDTWIQKGSDFEDEAPEDSNTCRASNHFHNPIKGWQNGEILGWDQAQKTDDSLSIRATALEVICRLSGWTPETRKSNLIWATEFLEPVADGARKIKLDRQSWSWSFARQYFYEALTSANTEAREIAFSNAFRAIGQVVHLVQDSAQPAHVRNDFQSHLVLTHIGVEKPTSWVGSPYEHYVKLHSELVAQAVPIQPNFENPSLTDFWDTNTYDGSVQLGGTNLGLAEHANANYFSERTIPNNVTSWWQLNRAGQIREHLFPYPALNNDDYEICTIEVGVGKFKTFVARKNRGGCDADDHMAQISLLDTNANIGDPNIPNYNISKAYMTMDNAVYETYAKELLPLAIGYSSALIDYFFRGRLGVIKKHNGLIVKNITDEQMSAYTDDDDQRIGKIEILYDRADGSRHLLAEHPLSQPLAAGEKTPLISFTPPADNATPDRYIVVFKGKLGKEEGAVMAKVVSPKIYYVAQHNIDDQIVRKIMRIEPDGQSKTVIYNNVDPDFIIGKIAISPDGSTLAFSGSTVNDTVFIYTLDISGSANKAPELITAGYLPDWSEEGDKLIFQRSVYAQGSSSRDSILSYDLKTGAITLLAGGNNRSDSQPAWSSSQNKIAYITNAEGEAPHDEPGPGEIRCGNLHRSIELMDASGNHTGSGTDCLTQFYTITDTGAQNGYPSRVSNIQLPVWSPDGNEIMYVGTFEFLNTNYTETGDDGLYLDYTYQPFKININTQQETALFNINDEIDIHYSGISSWSMDGKTIAVTRLGLNDNNKLDVSRSHIVLIDADTGEEIQDLTTLNPLGSFYPDFGY